MDHVPWLDDTEMRIWLAYLEATGRVNQHLDATVKEAADLRFDDYEVLVHLSEADDRRLRMTELSERLLHSQARLTQRINRLADRGLVRREKCPEDRRGTFAVITDDGIELITRVAPIHVADVRARLIDLIEPEEREVIARVLERIAAAAKDGVGRPMPVDGRVGLA
ncbi:MAG: MarR family transcriptional regulator [Actinomycetota bacterium]